jgi:uncharacterized membrane protein
MAALAVSATTSALAQEPSRYRVLDLNALTGRVDIDVTALNNRGDFTFVDYDDEHNYLWRSGRVHDLGAWGGGPMDLNDRGDVVGTRLLNGKRHVTFRWRNGRFTDITGPVGNTRSLDYAINGRGQVAGVADGRAFVYDGRHTRYLDLPGTSASVARDINDSGLVVGSATFPSDDLDARAITLRGNRSQTLSAPIDNLTAGFYEAQAVNNAGNTAVRYMNYHGGAEGSALYIDGRIFDLGYDAIALDINNHDWAAGYVLTMLTPETGQFSATLFHDGHSYGLERLMTAEAAAYWERLSNIVDINDRGYVVGSAVPFGAFSVHAFMAMPVPEAPGAVTLLAGLAVLGAALRVRRRMSAPTAVR